MLCLVSAYRIFMTRAKKQALISDKCFSLHEIEVPCHIPPYNGCLQLLYVLKMEDGNIFYD